MAGRACPEDDMKSLSQVLLLACLLLLATALQAKPPEGPGADRAPHAAGTVLLLDIRGGIGPATRDYLQRGIAEANDTGAAAIVLRIDTPGGLDASTRDIIRAILASDVPVIAWVAPEGARAASAGTYIVYASHLAAMAPATSLGAATPVALGGLEPSPPPDRTPSPKRDSPPNEKANTDAKSDRGNETRRSDEGSAPVRKAVNDAVSYLRGLAELRGRNADFAEAAVREAATLTAAQALAQHVVEIRANDIDSLLQQANGRQVALHRGTAILATGGAEVVPVTPDWRFKLLAVLTEPTVAYLLLLVGLYGLLLEGYSPGAILPGVVGAISLLLALYALQVLPVNYAGVALIVVGVILMATEFHVPSFGALGIGGLVALIVGSLILFDADVPGFGVPGQLILGVGAASALAFMGVVWLAARARKRPVTTGVAELLGREAVALDAFHGRGRVHIRGETWQAESAVPVAHGQALRVLAIDGLVLRVAPLAEPPSHPNRNGGAP
jgi:membrane-bound serine protease (ClpP class)